MKQRIVKKDWDYNFYLDDDKYILSVLCGTIALFEIKIELNVDEIRMFVNIGDVYIDRLAKEIQLNPSVFAGRNINEK